MDYESELKKSCEDFKSALSGTALEGYGGLLDFHINEMDGYAANCQFGPIAQHMREIGEESKNLDALAENLEKSKAISEKNHDEISEKLSIVWDKLDMFIANELVENCKCKMRGISY